MRSRPSLLHQAAIWYVRHKIPVFPCIPRHKEPLTEHGCKDATTDEAQIDIWWTERPNANIGMPTGKASGVVAFDIDPRHGGLESYEALIYRHGAFPDTAEQITGRGDGGRHIIVADPGIKLPAKLAEGIDIRAEGTYVIVAPSIHPAGGRYEWDGLAGREALLKPAACPEWVLKLASNGNEPKTRKVDFKIPKVIKDGDKHYTIVSLAGTLRARDLPMEAAFAACRAMQFASPVSDDDIQKRVENVYERYSERAAPNGPELLKEIVQYIRRYVVLPAAAYLPVALWAIATHAVLLFDCFAYLAILSAAKRSGKTRLAEVLERLVYRPWRGTAPSPAALYRMLEQAPTLLLDEVEVFNSKNKSETTLILLAVLNAGHRKGGTIPRCEGPKQEVRQFPVYGAKLFAAIGKLPDTLMDRSILIHMKRRVRSQPVERFRQAKAAIEAKPIHDAAAQFAKDHRNDIEQAYQRVLQADLEFLNDRDADLWTPLFAMCSLMAPESKSELEKSARALSEVKASDDVDDSYSLVLLRDIKTVWPRCRASCKPECKDQCQAEHKTECEAEPEEKCETASLLERLKALEEAPWQEHQLTPRKLAKMLKPFEVAPHNLQIETRRPKGYHFEDLKDVFARYLDEKCATSATNQ